MGRATGSGIHIVVNKTVQSHFIRTGGQLEVRMNCSLQSDLGRPQNSSQLYVDVLSTSDGKQYARYGYDLSSMTFFIGSMGMKTTSSLLQSAASSMPTWVSIILLVDGGVVESFTSDSRGLGGHATTRSFLPESPPWT